MEENMTIWSPVLLARLKENRRINEPRTYPLEISYRAMEDLRIRVKERQVLALGTAVEARIKLDILCLLADSEGHMHLFKREEIFHERIPLQEFDQTLKRDEPADYHLELKRVEWEGEINGRNVQVACFLEYSIIATREQLVRLRREERSEITGELLDEAMQQLELQIERIQQENAELKKQVFYHTSNISSLKQGLQKAEKRNAALSRENNAYQGMIEKMHGEVAAVGHAGGFSSPAQEYRSYLPNRGEYKITSGSEAGDSGSKINSNGLNQLGSRIKSLFQNNQ